MIKLDKLFINGNIYTMESDNEKVEAIGINDGYIVFCGSNDEAKKYEYKEIINLEGKAVIPGMADSHMHMYAYCQNKTSVNLENADSIDKMISLMKTKADVTEEGMWIKGVNFDQSKFKENRFPTREDLDKISTKHPIVIRRCCLHTIVANSMALNLAGVGKGYDGGTGGIVEFDDNGEPNGILREQSTKIFDEIIPDPLAKEEDKEKIMIEVLEDMASKGITAIHTYAAKIWKYNEDINLYRKLEREGKLPVRVTVYLDELFEQEILTDEQKKDPYRMVNQGGYKLFTDGSLGSRSAALNEPYSDDKNNSGFVICTQEELNNRVLKAYELGLQPAIHAIGDRALEMTLSAIENALEETRIKGMSKEEQNLRKPFRIIHVQMISDSILERMKKLPLVLDIQPIFLCTDLNWIEDRVGKERLSGTYCWKTMSDAGLIQTGGSDCPVEDYNPIKGIFAARARCELSKPDSKAFMPEEILSPYEAVLVFTKNVHYATGQENLMGTLTRGKFADIVVLNQNPFEIKNSELLNIKVVATYVGGKKVFG